MVQTLMIQSTLTRRTWPLSLRFIQFVGKEMNIVRAYEIFRKIQSQLKVDGKANRYTEKDIRSMFIVALQNLKYIGYISSTRRNTFTFKKNFLGNHAKMMTT
jgi:hypothetical protein